LLINNNVKGYDIEISNLKFNPPKGNKKGVLRDISFKIQSGEFVSFIGRNGHGKSSIFKAISGELKYLEGTVKVGNCIIDEPIHKLCGGVGIVHQYVQDDLIPELSILRNIQIRQLNCNDKKIRRETNADGWKPILNAKLSQFFRSEDFVPTNETLVDDLSGGQRQLLNVLISIELEHSSVIGCKLLLLDEHLTSLDKVVQNKVMQFIEERTQKTDDKPTILMITHDFEYALKYSDSIIVIYEGSVKEIIKRPTDKDEKWNMQYLNSVL